MRISDWSSDVCSSDLRLDLIAAYADSVIPATDTPGAIDAGVPRAIDAMLRDWASEKTRGDFVATLDALDAAARSATGKGLAALLPDRRAPVVAARSEEHTSELQSLMRISYAVFCLKKKINKTHHNQ